MSRRALAALLVLALAGGPAAAGGERRPSYLEQALERARAELDAAVAARPPVRRPPVPVKVGWQVRRLGAVDASAPLLALAVADADADGKADLIALTGRELLRLPITGGMMIAQRTPLPAGPPPLRPRDPVGTLVAGVGSRGALVLSARSSELAEGFVLAAQGGQLVEAGRTADFPLCTGGGAQLAPGRNYFVPGATMWPGGAPAELAVGNFHTVACGRGLVDPQGWPLAVVAIAGTDGRLLVRVARSCGREPGCDATPELLAIPGTGTAVAVADVDRDGYPEVIAAGPGAPGDPDQVTVYTLRGGAAKKVVQRPFTGGVVALAAGDADGDGADEVFAASRLLGSNQVTLWAIE